ncbi:MAG: hypothetical protein EOL89_08725 [Actinobacteria bacterium]|nr:hypothetical protein [Actinomycetota bacterium]
MNIAIPVTPDGGVEQGWGRAPRVAIVRVEDGAIADWEEHAVGWDVAREEGTEGAHHARIVRFLREHGVTHVVVAGMGAGMQRTLGKMGIEILPARSLLAREAVGLAARDVQRRD